MTMPIDPAALIAFVAEHNKRATFDGSIDELEQICRRDLPAPDASPAEDSRPWFAREILLAIRATRHWLARGEADYAAAEAATVGALAATAEHYPEVKRWSEHLVKQRVRSLAGVVTKRDNTARRDAALLSDVRAARLRHPDASSRMIASTLLAQHGRPGDRAKALDALVKRIARLGRRK
jgi:hypothetical protein